ncbi:hypothetical protein LINGRAHAP2_LOCUS7415 [Linum grandiflorum]
MDALSHSEASRAIRFQFRAKIWIIEARRILRSSWENFSGS